MFETDLLLVFIRKLNGLGAPYMVTGSVAGVLYGEPRVTHDVDLVVALRTGEVDRLVSAFPLEEFYCPPREVISQEVLRGQRGHFNLIHHASGFKADVYLANRDPLHAWALGERRQVDVDGEPVWVAPAEYVIVRKLEYFREGGSEKHLRDIEAILRVSASTVRMDIVQEWIARLGLAMEWQRVPKGD